MGRESCHKIPLIISQISKQSSKARSIVQCGWPNRFSFVISNLISLLYGFWTFITKCSSAVLVPHLHVELIRELSLVVQVCSIPGDHYRFIHIPKHTNLSPVVYAFTLYILSYRIHHFNDPTPDSTCSSSKSDTERVQSA